MSCQHLQFENANRRERKERAASSLIDALKKMFEIYANINNLKKYYIYNLETN